MFFSLLLARQALTLLMLSATSLTILHRRREQIEALFVADAPLAQSARREVGLAALLAPDLREGWLPALLADMGGGESLPLDEAAMEWAERGKVAYLVARGRPDRDNRALLIKLFHRSLAAMGHHECDLLEHAGPDWPAVVLVGKREIEGHLALVFHWRADCAWAPPPTDRTVTLTLRKHVLSCEIPADLAARYLRSRQRLPQAICAVDWPMLAGLAATPEQAADCARLEAVWPTLRGRLACQPSQIVLPKLTARRMVRTANGSRLICNWTLWRWEPLGFD